MIVVTRISSSGFCHLYLHDHDTLYYRFQKKPDDMTAVTIVIVVLEKVGSGVPQL